jgi:N-acetylneuraminate synthase
MNKVRIAGKWIGDGEPCFIVAEAGVNHNGEIRLAKKLIDVAKSAGADAVKFQAFETGSLVTPTAEKAEYQKKRTGDGFQYAMLKKLELTPSDFKTLSKHAKKKGIIFLSTPYDAVNADLLDEIGVPAFKIASCDITNLPLLEHIAKKKRPIILSTGMSTMSEIREALHTINKTGNKDVILLQCTSDYPAKLEDANLRAIPTLKQTFKVQVGYSDHTVGIYPPIAAVALGASIIEKHFTLDRNLPGPDHKMSLEPVELKEMIKAIRCVERALGSRDKKPTMSEEKMKKFMRKSIVARVNIAKGTTISEGMLTIKRPGTGIEPKYFAKIIGYKAKKDIKKDEVITWDKVAKL